MSLEIWVIYDHPRDDPEMFVARMWVLDQPTGITFASPSLDLLRRMLPPGLHMMPRQENDDPVILETWF